MVARIVPISDLRRQTGQLVAEASSGSEPVYITQHGRPTIVLLGYEAYEALMARLEDLSDLASLREAADEPYRPYDEFLAERKAEE